MHTNGTLRIWIVGGSLGGLFAAALLRMDGHQVRIYERSVTGVAGRGAGLVGQRDIFAILRAVGCEHVAHVGVVALERKHSTATAASRIGKRHPRCRFPGIIFIVRSERSLRAMTMFWHARCVRS